MNDPTTGIRKHQQLRIALTEDVEGSCGNGFERYELVHNALPEAALESVDLAADFLGRRCALPFLIESMTGGYPEASILNRNLARAAEELGIGLCVGSQRAMFEDASVSYTFQVREVAPEVFLLGNLGGVQLRRYGADAAVQLMHAIGADGITIHLNAAHEVCQPGGDTDWTGVLEEIRLLCAVCDGPVVVKETGFGVSAGVAVKLAEAGVAAIDVAGAGGTCWTRIEAARTGTKPPVPAGWGIRTADSLVECRRVTRVPLIASGGIRSGLDAAKALALGASLVGLARPLLAPAMESAEAVVSKFNELAEQLRVIMFLVGAGSIAELGKVELRNGAT